MNTLWTPKVSIIIPVYNGSNFLREAIDSALSQTYKNIEIIVVNDGSDDNGATKRIAQSYGDKIIYFEKENGGVSSALNYGIKRMTGDYLSWLSHDDVYSSEKIYRQIISLSDHADDKTIALCAHCFIDENSMKLSKKAPRRFDEGMFGWESVLQEILVNGTFSGCAMMIPKSAFVDCGYFDEELRFSQDALMWIKLCLAKYSLVYNSYVGVYSRIHQNQLTETGRELFKKDSFLIGQMLIPQLLNISDEKTNFLYLFATRQAKYGNQNVVRACIDVAGNLFGIKHKIFLNFGLIYGRFRPMLRRVYYQFCVKPRKDIHY